MIFGAHIVQHAVRAKLKVSSARMVLHMSSPSLAHLICCRCAFETFSFLMKDIWRLLVQVICLTNYM